MIRAQKTSDGMRLLSVTLVVLFAAISAQAWELSSGENITGKLIAYNYEEKKAEFTRKESLKTIRVPAKDLSLRSKQRLLINEIFLSSYPKNPAFPPEKRYLFGLAVVGPMAALLIGFWIAGLLLAGKVNPVRAVIGCVGGWILLTTFMLFYFFFAARLGGGWQTIVLGGFIGLIAMSVFVSAIYQCGIFKGFAIFLAQIFVAVFISVVGLALTETLIEIEKVESFWDSRVFDRVGML